MNVFPNKNKLHLLKLESSYSVSILNHIIWKMIQKNEFT